MVHYYILQAVKFLLQQPLVYLTSSDHHLLSWTLFNEATNTLNTTKLLPSAFYLSYSPTALVLIQPHCLHSLNIGSQLRATKAMLAAITGSYSSSVQVPILTNHLIYINVITLSIAMELLLLAILPVKQVNRSGSYPHPPLLWATSITMLYITKT